MPKETLQDAIHNWQADEGMTDATMLAGQLEVIAEELRTANLIALIGKVHPSGAGVFSQPEIDKARQQVAERLGLS